MLSSCCLFGVVCFFWLGGFVLARTRRLGALGAIARRRPSVHRRSRRRARLPITSLSLRRFPRATARVVLRHGATGTHIEDARREQRESNGGKRGRQNSPISRRQVAHPSPNTTSAPTRRTSATHAAMADAVKSDVNGSGGPVLGGAMLGGATKLRKTKKEWISIASLWFQKCMAGCLECSGMGEREECVRE